MLTPEQESLYWDAIDADNLWQHELNRLFGKNAGDVRYTKEGKGEPGTELYKAHEAYQAATKTWLKAMNEVSVCSPSSE